ncbi:glycosyltransferase [Paenibacillus silviterrae]|uniref:glycosyltransferase n=1 Tax=Paenibacillus silviterrae TaxID=3242194 RepID=UPI00254309CD|nr:glycosyltransferase [Paenibacillus chinjuensis]
MTKARKLLIISPVAERGGAERVMEDILKHLDRDQYTPIVVFFQEGTLAQEFSKQGIPTYVLEAGQLRNLWKYTLVVRQLKQLIAKEGIDAVISWMPKAHLYASLAGALSGVTVIWWQHSIPDHHWMDRLASKLPAAGVICPSMNSQKAQEKLTRKPVLLNYLGVDLEQFNADSDEGSAVRKQYGITPEAKVFTFIGRLQRWKRPDVVIKAFQRIQRVDRDAYLFILGGVLYGLDEDYEQELRSLAAECSDPSRIIFLGHQQNVMPFLSATDVVVHASMLEPFGMVVAESMAMGKAVVAVGRGGPSEVIASGRNGLLYDGSEQELASVLESIVSGRVNVQELSREARRTVQERFTVKHMTSAFESNLRRLLPAGDGVFR